MYTKAGEKIHTRVKTLAQTYHDFPGQFWVLVLGTFIDRLGGALLFPFFTLYLTRKFGISMTTVGLIFGLFSISSVIGSIIGGAMTDRFGRKGMLLFGLVMSGLSSVLMGVIDTIVLFAIVVPVIGILSDSGGPAQQALVADLLPDEKRAEGFGILRVTVNMAVVIGPIIGGLLATRSYLLLFIVDAVTSLITAAVVALALKETRVHEAATEMPGSITQTFRGYFDVAKDSAFVWFLAISALMVLVYMNMNTTLAVYLRDSHGITERGFGYILSLNAAMVVLFQFSFTRWVNRYRPLIIMFIGTLFYAIGFALYGFVSTYFLFLVAMAIITIGEMMVSPVGQAIVARLAPEDMRGRYMAVYGFSWVIPMAIGPLLAGIVMDNFSPQWVWYLAGIVGFAAALGYYLLEWKVGRSRWQIVDARVNVIERLENGEITAEEAGLILENVGDSAWQRLLSTETKPAENRRHLRIRVSDLASGAIKSDLHIPLGLVNIVLYAGGRLSVDLESHNLQHLLSLISSSDIQQKPQRMQAGSDEIEVSVE